MTQNAVGLVKTWLLPVGLMLGLGSAAVGLLSVLEQERPPSARAAELSYLPKGEYLKVAVLGYEQIVADVLWLKAVQHFGGRRQTSENYLWAYHAVDVVTDLDPKFVLAYQAAGTILAVWAGHVEESIAILKKGVRHNPENWRLPFLLGYDYFYELCDRATAAEYLRTASALPGAPPYLPRLAARMTVETGDAEVALEFLERLYRQTKDERTRESIEQRVKEVIAERDIRFLEEGVRRYKVRYGAPPRTLEDLVVRQIIVQVPEEPLGGRYVLTGQGSVKSTGLQERLRVHVQVNPKIPCHLEAWVQ